MELRPRSSGNRLRRRSLVKCSVLEAMEDKQRDDHPSGLVSRYLM